jgi:hypothetical protein
VRLFFARLSDGIEAVGRAVGSIGIGHDLSFQAMGPPGWQPRCPFAYRGDQAMQSKAPQRLAVMGGSP